MSSPEPTYRLVGVGRCTVGLMCMLRDRQPVVLGRGADCHVHIQRVPEGRSDVGPISRLQAVVDFVPDRGWCICDSSSVNGTAVLREGLPPTIHLVPSVYYPLAPGDIVELAGSPDYQFVFQRAPRTAVGDVMPTVTLVRSGVRSVQYLVDGYAVAAFEVGASGVRLTRDAAGVIRPEVPGDETPSALTLTVVNGQVRAEAFARGLMVNQVALVAGAAVILRDRDQITSATDPGVIFLFLDPTAIVPRRLSDLLMGHDTVTFGTAEDNTCRLGDPSVSRHHARVERRSGELIVHDLGSANGTVVNDRRVIGQHVLREGQQLWIGRLLFVVDAACWTETTVSAQVSIDIRFVRVAVEIAGKLRLRGVSFGLQAGEMVGILGPSASGKSTLLGALAGQLRLSGGDIYVNGRSISGGHDAGFWFRRLLGFGPDTREVGFVQQIDLLPPELSVREMLEFAARQMGLSGAEATARADHAAEVCNLGPLLERVAIAGTGQLAMSGGQLKRVSVALEVLRRPRVLVLDEPTTGQDPKNSDDLMRLFRTLATQGVTLLMSTHDLQNLLLFNKVVVVALGYLVYFGPPEQFAPYFGAESPAKVYASLPDREDRLDEAKRLAERFQNHPLYRTYCAVEA